MSRTNVHPSSALGSPACQAAAATRSWSLWPSSPGHTIGFPFILFWSIDTQTTDVEWTFYAPPPDTKEREKAWEMFIQVFDAVMNEDFMSLAPMQQSISSGALESIPLSHQERRIYHLHEEIDRLTGVANVPQALRVPPRLEPF